MNYIIYKVINKLNGKTYIGSHKTEDLDDGYMGSGKYLKRAIEKHGIENFTKEILFVFDNSQEMFTKEAELVNEDYLSENNTYNLKIGGQGGWDFINENMRNKISKISSEYHLNRHKKDKNFHEKTISRLVDYNFKKISKEKRKIISSLCLEARKTKYPNGVWKNRKHSEETKKKMSESKKGKCFRGTGFKQSEETKQKIRESIKKFHKNKKV